MQRVWRVRGDVGVAARRGQALLRERRRVVAVDEIVRDARMVGVLGELLLEDAGRLEVRGIRLVGRGLRRGEVERVEDLRFVVVRVLRRERLVGLRARELALALTAVGEVLVVGGDRLEVVALALGFAPILRPLSIASCASCAFLGEVPIPWSGFSMRIEA